MTPDEAERICMEAIDSLGGRPRSEVGRHLTPTELDHEVARRIWPDATRLTHRLGRQWLIESRALGRARSSCSSTSTTRR